MRGTETRTATEIDPKTVKAKAERVVLLGELSDARDEFLSEIHVRGRT